MKNITILGVTGSIGQQTVDVCLHHQDEFNVVAMSAGKNIVLLETTIQKINPQVVCVIDEKDCNYLQEKYPHIRFVFGSAAELEYDKQGRVLIPVPLREYASLDKQAVIVGAGDHVEIWSREKYDYYDDQVAESMEELVEGLEGIML